MTNNVLCQRTVLCFLFLFCFFPALSSNAAAAPKFKVVALAFPDANHAGTDTAGANCLRRLAAKDSFSVDIWTDKSKFTSANIMAYDLMVWVMAAPLSWSAANMTAFDTGK